MTAPVWFVVPGEPMSKARARVVNGHAYTPQATKDAEVRVLAAYLPRRIGPPLTGDLSVSLRFECATRMRRDLDNLVKLCLDALNRHAWVDDSQIQALHAERVYVPKGTARTVISITSLPGSVGTP